MKNRSGLLALGLVAVLTAAIVGFVLWEEGKRSERLTEETAAVGFAATETEWRDSDDRNVQGHTLTFAYVAGDSVYPRTMEEVTWYDPAKTYKVCYDPADPNDWKLYPSDHVCGS